MTSCSISYDSHKSSRIYMPNLKRIKYPYKSTVHKILLTHNFHPYHIALTKDLTPDDFRRRLVFCNWTQTMLQHDRILQVCIF